MSLNKVASYMPRPALSIAKKIVPPTKIYTSCHSCVYFSNEAPHFIIMGKMKEDFISMFNFTGNINYHKCLGCLGNCNIKLGVISHNVTDVKKRRITYFYDRKISEKFISQPGPIEFCVDGDGIINILSNSYEDIEDELALYKDAGDRIVKPKIGDIVLSLGRSECTFDANFTMTYKYK